MLIFGSQVQDWTLRTELPNIEDLNTDFLNSKQFSRQLNFLFLLKVLIHQSRPVVHYPSFIPFFPPTSYTHPLLFDNISWEQ